MIFSNVTFDLSAYLPEQIPPSNLPEIVFSGRSNVGKSSMINKLINRKSLARVSSAPGKTASVNFYLCGDKLKLVDLPGYGYAKVSFGEKVKWSELVEGFFAGDRNIKLAVQLLDVRHAPTEDDLIMLNFLKQTDKDLVIVFTKCDKLKKSELEKRKLEIPSEVGIYEQNRLVYFSTQTGSGVEELTAAILERI